MAEKRTKKEEAEFIRKVRELGKQQSTIEEIAAVMGCTKEELNEDKYRVIWQEGRLIGYSSLRKHQFKMAESYPNMAIFLGRVYLNQVEAKAEATDTSKGAFLLWLKSQE